MPLNIDRTPPGASARCTILRRFPYAPPGSAIVGFGEGWDLPPAAWKRGGLLWPRSRFADNLKQALGTEGWSASA